MNKEEITITKEDLVQWLDRPPSNEDLDLCEFLANAVQNRQKYYEANQELKEKYMEIEDKYIHNVPCCNEEDCDLFREHQELKDRIDKAVDVINTQMKNADEGTKENLRIIKFNLIKGSCTFEDLKTEEDYKY